MRIIFDTNVILSAFLTQGLSSRVLDISIDRHNIFISQWIIDEVSDKLKNKFNIPANNLSQVLSFIQSEFKVIKPEGTMPEICRDKYDNNILHLAGHVKADLIITGDKDLLNLISYNNIAIVNPREFMEKYHK